MLHKARHFTDWATVTYMGLLYKHILSAFGKLHFAHVTSSIADQFNALEYVNAVLTEEEAPSPDDSPLHTVACGDHYHHVPVWHYYNPKVRHLIDDLMIEQQAHFLTEELEEFINTPREEDK